MRNIFLKKEQKIRILITGGAGYIGSILTGKLLEKGHQLNIIDNFMYSQNSLSNYFSSKNLEVINADVRDESIMKETVKKVDAIIPLAAIVGAPACLQDPFLATSINKESVKSLLRMVSDEQLILMPTTNSAYGTGNSNNFCDESSPLNPLSQYAREKVEVEEMLMSRDNSISLRLATVFGMSPRMRLDLLVNEFVLRAVKDGFLILFESHFKRNYIHVRDVANAFSLILDNVDNFNNEIFNVGLSEANISKYELCELIKQKISTFYFVEAEVGSDPDKRNYIVSNKKIEDRGFKPQFSLSEGIDELIMGLKTLNTKLHTNIRK